MTNVDDLAYFYLDLMDALDLRDVTLVGVSFGAWIAAEIAVKSTARLARLVLANPVGIKVGDRETRDIVDIFAITEDEFNQFAFADPASGKRDYASLPEAEVVAAARNRESTGALRLVALYAQSQTRRPAASHPHSDAGAVGRGRPHRARRLWPRLLRRPFPARSSSRSSSAGHFPHLEQPEVFADRFIVRANYAHRSHVMRVYHFTEQPYPNAWADQDGPLRVTLPNSYLDPKVAADLFHRYYDEWLLADELGLDIMINEHHSTATCMSATCSRAAVDPGAADQARAAAGARLSDRPPARPAAGARKNSPPST